MLLNTNGAKAMALPEYLSVSEVATQIGDRPKDISDLFYIRKLDAKTCPLVACRRMIPRAYIPTIIKTLKTLNRPLEAAK